MKYKYNHLKYNDACPLTLFLGSPLELQHHVVVSDEGMNRAVEVERAPQQQTVFPPQLRNHDGDQTAGEGLQTHGSCDVIVRGQL